MKDPVMRYSSLGNQIVEFPIAYNRRYMVGDVWKEESHFFEVKAYGKLAESLVSRVSKGYTVVIEGRLTQERWVDKEGKTQSRIRIVADSVRIINKPKMEEPVEELPLKEEDIPEETMGKPFSSEDDEIPF
ncbi:single-stranded DNA-binding protein [Hydrogenobacter sp. T-2]|uniref:single-stranded DNA-binding protein n=1 Tax=Pampinifervens diazotrophicum TaxID=1632018 RepID=UPI002B2645C7|nr:single-stranded DNA-binding protein [Hydrogenobacter sp. T-2]WPM32109.1 single-stranded DNA-binding protein [Hydrogenobacter sp. T-2]